MDIKKLEKFLAENNQPKFRLGQILKAVYQDGVSAWEEITTLPKELVKRMSELKMLPFEVEKVLLARDKNSAKAALRLEDGNVIETVLMSPAPDVWSVCVSTQAGCPMGCAFCATGKGGFKRNLTAEEITDQVLFWRQWLRRSVRNTTSDMNTTRSNKNPSLTLPFAKGENIISNVVYMGMGEPFLNWDQVKESLEDLIDPKKFGFGSRSISVSTVGIPEGIVKFAKDFSQMNLALSLHFADDRRRSQFIPANLKYSLSEIKKSLQEYFQLTRRKVFIEYIMLTDVNDSRTDAERLARYLRAVGDIRLLHVNLIRYNATDNNFKSSSKEKTVEFKNCLLQNNISVTIRKSLGEEIQGACGQLAGIKNGA